MLRSDCAAEGSWLCSTPPLSNCGLLQVRVNSATSSEEVGDLLGRRHSSGAMPSPLPSSLLKGLEPSGSPSPEQSHEEALSRPRGFHTSLSGDPIVLTPFRGRTEALLVRSFPLMPSGLEPAALCQEPRALAGAAPPLPKHDMRVQASGRPQRALRAAQTALAARAWAASLRSPLRSRAHSGAACPSRPPPRTSAACTSG